MTHAATFCRLCRQHCGAGSTFFVGRSVQKEFKGFGTFTGRVTDFHSTTGYRIEYEDGDSEDVTEAGLVRKQRMPLPA